MEGVRWAGCQECGEHLAAERRGGERGWAGGAARCGGCPTERKEAAVGVQTCNLQAPEKEIEPRALGR